jgi:hypothetical protein
MDSTDWRAKQEEREESSFQQRLVGAISWVIGFLAAGAVILEAQRDGGSLGAMWLFLLFAWVPVIFVHELGHAIAALAVGWRVQVFHVAPVALRLHPFSAMFATSLSGPDVAGSVFATPSDERTLTRLRDMTIGAGGPLMSLALALVLVGCALFGWPPQEDLALIARLRMAFDPTHAPTLASADMPRAILFGLGAYSLVGFVLSAWPLYGPYGPKNDAAMIVNVWTNGVGPTHLAAFHYAHILWGLGVPSEHWPPWMTKGLDELRHEPDDAHTTYELDVLAALQSGDIALRDKLAAMREARPNLVDPAIAEAFVAACVDRDFALARQKLAEDFDPNAYRWFSTTYLWQLTQAALAANTGETEAYLEAVRRSSSTMPFTHDFWLAQIERARGADSEGRAASNVTPQRG